MPNSEYRVYVNGQEVFVHESYRLNLNIKNPNLIGRGWEDAIWDDLGNGLPLSRQGFAMFDFTGRVFVEIEMADYLMNEQANFRLAPESQGIEYVFFNTSTNRVGFYLPKPGHLTIDPFGNGEAVLHLFSNRPEDEWPDVFSDPGVLVLDPGTHTSLNDYLQNYHTIFFKPGVHEVWGQIELGANQHLYLHSGAVLRPLLIPAFGETCPTETHDYTGIEYDACPPAITIEGDNATIRGRGIISGERAFSSYVRFGMIRSRRADNVRVEDIIISRGSRWNLHFYDSDNARVDNVRVLGAFSNTDGILFNQSNNTNPGTPSVSNSFVHVADDGLEIKTFGPKPSDGISFSNSQTWSDVGTPLGITNEVEGDITNASFSDITILRYTQPGFTAEENPDPYRASIMVHAASGGDVSDVTFERIVIEDHASPKPLILVTNKDSGPNYSGIHRLTFDTILATLGNIPPNPPSRGLVNMYDKSPAGSYTDIVIDKLQVDGVWISDRNDPRVVIDNHIPVDFKEPPGC